jgi:tetratricopeptide (TPR) repeat protein
VRVAEIAIDAGRLARGEALAATVGRDCPTLATLRLRIARAHASAGDHGAAHHWLDRASELATKPTYFQPNLAIALAAAELGETDRAGRLADAVDRATWERSAPYGAPEHIDLARVYAALGRHDRVDEILAGYAAVHAQNIAVGFASAARAYAELGRADEARKLATRAEGKLRGRDTLGRGVLARAYLALGEFARAIEHARKISDYTRIDVLVDIARAARVHSVEVTPQLQRELAQLESGGAQSP